MRAVRIAPNTPLFISIPENIGKGICDAPSEITEGVARQFRTSVRNTPKRVRAERQRIPAQLENQQEEPKEEFERVHMI